MYDVVIIGAGSAGLAARKDVSLSTTNYLVVDTGPFGTTCARVGCMPSKVLIEAAHIFHQRKKFPVFGATFGQDPVLDGRALMSHVRKLRDHYVSYVLKDMNTWNAQHLKIGSARFLSTDTLQVGDEKVQARKFIVATGSEPTLPSTWGRVEGLNTTDDIFEIETLPQSLVVIGVGAVGLELGQAFARLGVKVTAIGDAHQLAGLSDPAILEAAHSACAQEFEIVNDEVNHIEKIPRGFRVRTSSRSVEVERVLVAVGRTPRLAALDLKKAGANLNEKGDPEFDPLTTRIRGTTAYVVGDANRLRPLLHEAVDQGRISALNSTNAEGDQEYRLKTRLAILFTHPNIAVVGAKRADLLRDQIDFVEGFVSFENQGRAVAKLENVGAIQVYAHKETGKILGAELAAPAGEHLAHLLAWAIEAERTVFCLIANPVYHPVLEEGLRTALKNAARKIGRGQRRLNEIRCDDAPAG